MADVTGRAIAYIAECIDPEKLRRMAVNARRLGNYILDKAPSLRRYNRVWTSPRPASLPKLQPASISKRSVGRLARFALTAA